METHDTITAVQEMRHTLKEILNVLKDIKGNFKKTTTSAEMISTVRSDDEFLRVLADIDKQFINKPVENKSTEKVKENVETT